ncbi:hypothetical protein CBS101457_000867 [Exobasidium rhododendri]|nr:hypothetical protein CBS101457_000867 [Exobasidium rhododendri]
MHFGTSVTFLASMLLLSGSAMASITSFSTTSNSYYSLAKRDPSGVPADILTEGCAIKNPGYAANHTDHGIQLGECYINARIMKQMFCTFEPTDGDMKSSREGGPYGSCSCYNAFPKSTDLMSFENLNYACLAWTKKNAGYTPPKLPGEQCIPFPLVCPINLKGCYAKDYWTSSGPASLLPTANEQATCKMYWSPEKAFQGGKAIYCDHIQEACEVPTNLQFMQRNFTCDVSKCVPYQGSFKLLTPELRASGTNNGQSTTYIVPPPGGSNPVNPGGKGNSAGGTGSGSYGVDTIPTNQGTQGSNENRDKTATGSYGAAPLPNSPNSKSTQGAVKKSGKTSASGTATDTTTPANTNYQIGAGAVGSTAASGAGIGTTTPANTNYQIGAGSGGGVGGSTAASGTGVGTTTPAKTNYQIGAGAGGKSAATAAGVGTTTPTNTDTQAGTGVVKSSGKSGAVGSTNAGTTAVTNTPTGTNNDVNEADGKKKKSKDDDLEDCKDDSDDDKEKKKGKKEKKEKKEGVKDPSEESADVVDPVKTPVTKVAMVSRNHQIKSNRRRRL